MPLMAPRTMAPAIANGGRPQRGRCVFGRRRLTVSCVCAVVATAASAVFTVAFTSGINDAQNNAHQDSVAEAVGASMTRRRQQRRRQQDQQQTEQGQDNNKNNNSNPKSDKSYKICNILGGLDVTRLVSSSTRSFFGDAIYDVELIREFVSEAATAGSTNNVDLGGFVDLDSSLGSTLDWAARGLPPGTTTVQAGLGYCDDRADRRIERYVAVGDTNVPIVGTRLDDMAIIDAVGLLFPWIVDRKSKEDLWHLDHQNGRSEGPAKVPFATLDAPLYTAAWIGTYGESWAYYPPLRVYGHPLGFGDVLGPNYDSHEEAFVKPNLPENNPERAAFFTDPYPDTAVPGLSLITAMAPIYFTGTFRGNTYDDTYLASTGVDIAVSSVSHLLDVLEDRLTFHSFGMLVDVDAFNTIVLSQTVVERIYPPRTGFEDSRVEYSTAEPGVIVHDRRNQTYLVSDTILQPLTDLTNADWVSLNHDVKKLTPGERGYSVLDLTLTGDADPTTFYVMYERWEHVANWVLLVFAPVAEVENAIRVELAMEAASAGGGAASDKKEEGPMLSSSIIELEASRGGPPVSGAALLTNTGTLDVTVTARKLPSWIVLKTNMNNEELLPAGQSLELKFDASTDGLDLGTTSATLSFLIQDDHYPDCFHSQDLGLEVQVRVSPQSCAGGKVDSGAGCVCPEGTVGSRCINSGTMAAAVILPLAVLGLIAIVMYTNKERRQADSVWAVKPDELKFDTPPVIVGRGTFGLVILAEYRGTKVAVKRVLPPKSTPKKKRRGGGGEDGEGGTSDVVTRRNSMLGSGDESAVMEEMERPGPGFGSNIADDVDNYHRSTNKSGKMARKGSIDFMRKASRKVVNNSDLFDFGHGDGNNDGVEEKNASQDAMESGTLIHKRKNGYSHGNGVNSINDGEHSTAVVRFQVSDGATETKTKTSTSGRLISSVDGNRSGSMSMSGSGSGSGSGSESGSGIRFCQGSGTLSQQERKWSWWNKNVRRRDEYAILKADFIQEMRQLSKLRHPCITTVMGAVISSYQEPMLVMEFMDMGSLYDVLHNDTMTIEGELVLPILRDIASGVRFLHAATPQVIHGDLKAQNVLVDIKMRAKVADFGLSQKKKVGATGTPLWMAPELLRLKSGNTSASDVYSFGIILYEVYSRKDPYEGEDYYTVLQQICDPGINKRPPVPKSMPPAAASLMSDCLVNIAQHRPTFEEIDQRLRRLTVETVEPGELHLSHQAKKERKSQRTNDLLFDVFPQKIAEALRDGRKVEPEHRDVVTIFFSDIVGFTDISSTLSPLKVSGMLDRLYNSFDNLSRKHDVFKVETIGDAYMAVTNLVKDQPDHAKRIAEFSIDALAAANQTLIDLDDPSRGHVEIRVGFHAGPIVANVVGSRNPRYCLFGDTVNTASRMESNSKKNRIHCSERAAKLVKKQSPEIGIRKRGRIPIKGKGEMTTYWVNERSSNRRGTMESNASLMSESNRSLMSEDSDVSSHDSSSHVGEENNASNKRWERCSSMRMPGKNEQHAPELGVLAEDVNEEEEGVDTYGPLED